ncbi:hypothetical protein HN51_027743 [Arachis hypogaea]
MSSPSSSRPATSSAVSSYGYSLVESNQHQSQGTYATRNPWKIVVAKAIEYLLSSLKNVRTEMKAQNLKLEQIKHSLVARFSKVLFYGIGGDAEQSQLILPGGDVDPNSSTH